MSSSIRAQLVCAALLIYSAESRATPLTLDLPGALARARGRAPDAVGVKARVGEAEATRAGARVRRNPELDLGGGPRFDNPRRAQIETRITQPFEPGRRDARIRVADAGVELAVTAVDAKLRELDLDVTTRFVEARHAELVVELAIRAQDLATRAADAAERRRKAGDVTDLDVNLAKIALGRARSAVAAAHAEKAAALGRLAVLIGAAPDDAITLVGDLRPTTVSLAALRAAVPGRPDVRMLVAEGRVATADAALARANGRPLFSLWFGYEREEAASILVGGVTLTLPLFGRAQGDKAAAHAKQRRIDAEHAAIAGAASRHVLDVFEAYTRAREAVEVFDRDVLPLLADSEKLLDRSIETGQIAVATYLIARQEVIAGRREHLDRQLALAKSAALAKFVAGVTP